MVEPGNKSKPNNPSYSAVAWQKTRNKNKVKQRVPTANDDGWI